MNKLLFGLVSAYAVFLIACNNISNSKAINKSKVSADSLLYKEAVLQNNFADSCFVFKDDEGDTISFNRNFEIIENTFGDTMNISFNYVRPGDKGKYFTLQIDSGRATLFKDIEYRDYIEEKDLPELYTKWICLYNLNLRWGYKTTGRGSMRIRVYYKPKSSSAPIKGSK